MATTWFSFFLSLLLLLHGNFAQQRYQQQYGQQCQINRLNPQEPSFRMQAEAGVTEFFDTNNQQFQCAGVSLFRHVIQSRGLLLPSYTNSPLLAYVVQGRGFYGIMNSGCPETFQSSQQTQQRIRGRTFQDRHQKIEQFRQGDIMAFPAGAAHWLYNEGNEEVVLVVLEDASNNANQLDQTSRGGLGITVKLSPCDLYVTVRDVEAATNTCIRVGCLHHTPWGMALYWILHEREMPCALAALIYRIRFFIAGNPQQGQQQQGRQYGGSTMRREQFRSGNVFNGFDIEILSEAFGVDREMARRLQGQDDMRGHIVSVQEGLRVIRPPFSQEQEEQQEQGQYGRGPMTNGIEETICTAKVRENIDNPARADIYNPRAGRLSTVNSFTLPILSFLRLSAARGVLYRNSMMAPHWYENAHSIIYITRGESRIQIVDHRGRAVLDDQVREGQCLVVPQNYAIVKQAGNEGCEWIAFNTNDNAMINTLSGRTSAIRGLPLDVIANAYQISRDEARRLKFNRDETLIFRSTRRSPRSYERVIGLVDEANSTSIA